MSKILNKSFLFAAMAAVIAVSGSVHAQMVVTDPVHTAVNQAGWAQQATQMGTMNSQLVTINTQLKTTDTYLQTGFNGNGLIPLLSSINDKLGKVNANDGQANSNDNITARARLYDQNMIDMKAAATPTQEEFKRACVAISSRMTSAQGHGAARGSSDAIRSSREAEVVLEDRIKTPGTPTQKVADLVRSRSNNGFCDKQDAENGFPGCTSEGDLPNADVRASSLTLGATTAASDPSNGSLNAKQAAAARAYIMNTVPMPPVMPSTAALETESGKRYLVGLNRFTARSAASSTAMNNILASHQAVPLTVNGQAESSPMMRDWAERKKDWETIFGPQVAYPGSPSERDMMRYEVFHYYISPYYQNFLSTLAADPRGEVMTGREMLKQQALTNRILFQLLQRQEDANVMMAQLLNQQMDPVSTASLTSAAANAGK